MALLTVSDIKTELGESVSLDGQDTHLQLLVDGVLSLWDDYTGRIWLTDSYIEFFSGEHGTDKVFLSNTPVSKISYIYDDSDWIFGDDTIIDESDYNYNPENGTVYCEIGFDSGFRNIKVEYEAGYTSATFPKSIKMVLLRQIAHWFKKGKDFPGYDLSASSRTDLISNLLPEFLSLANIHGRFM